MGLAGLECATIRLSDGMGASDALAKRSLFADVRRMRCHPIVSQGIRIDGENVPLQDESGPADQRKNEPIAAITRKRFRSLIVYAAGAT